MPISRILLAAIWTSLAAPLLAVEERTPILLKMESSYQVANSAGIQIGLSIDSSYHQETDSQTVSRLLVTVDGIPVNIPAQYLADIETIVVSGVRLTTSPISFNADGNINAVEVYVRFPYQDYASSQIYMSKELPSVIFTIREGKVISRKRYRSIKESESVTKLETIDEIQYLKPE